MSESKGVWTDQEMDDIIGALLRTGVVLAALVVLAGGILYLYHHGHGFTGYQIFQGEPSDLRTVSGIARDALGLHARGVIQLGLLLLIATPVMRVAFTIIAFALQRDRTYVAVTLIVFSLLLFSLLGSSR